LDRIENNGGHPPKHVESVGASRKASREQIVDPAAGCGGCGSMARSGWLLRLAVASAAVSSLRINTAVRGRMCSKQLTFATPKELIVTATAAARAPATGRALGLWLALAGRQVLLLSLGAALELNGSDGDSGGARTRTGRTMGVPGNSHPRPCRPCARGQLGCGSPAFMTWHGGRAQ
jgi:hypothetical protein